MSDGFKEYDLSKPLYVIGDVHGCYETLMLLIDSLPYKTQSQLIFVGDLVDRGPSSAWVVEFVKQNAYPCVLGNHEELMLEYCRPNESLGGYGRAWIENGGHTTLRSYQEYFKEDPKEQEKLLQKHLDWLETLPYFLEINSLDTLGQSLYVTHGFGLPYYHKKKVSKEKIIWSRLRNANVKEEVKKNYGVFNVFGHDVQKQVLIERNFACVDTGCVYAEIRPEKAAGALSALEWPSKRVFYKEFCD